VCTRKDAVECFCTSPVDALIMGPFIIEKESLASVLHYAEEKIIASPV